MTNDHDENRAPWLDDEASRIDFLGPLNGLWNRIPRDIRLNIEHNFLPEDPRYKPLPGEDVQLEIKMAPYRDILGHTLLHRFPLLLIITLLLMAVIGILGVIYSFTLWTMILPWLGLLGFSIFALFERIEYLQWRLIKTNARLIISLPQPNSRFLVDNIELKGLPNVIDTNWSRNPIWRIFQAATGARDLYISLSGYQFAEGTARVRDALVMPDVRAGDIFELKKLVFRIPGGAQPVKFESPQQVVPVNPPPDENRE